MTKKSNEEPGNNTQSKENVQTGFYEKVAGYLNAKWFTPTLFLILAILYFSPYLGLNKIIMGTDDGPRGWHTVGNYGHAIESFKDNWSPLNGGTAMMERRFGRFINPTHLLHMIMSKYKARTLEYLFWTFIAGFFTFLFLRTLSISLLVSYLCGIAFMFAPAFQSYIFGGHFARMEAIALLPAVMFFTERMLNKASFVNIIGLAAVIALCVYSDHLQLAYFTFAGMGFYFAIRIIWMVYKAKEITLKEGSKRTAFFAIALFIGCMLTSMSIFPSMHHTDVTSKRAGGVDYEYAASWGLHSEEIFSLAQPDFIGCIQTYWGQNQIKLNSEYFGVIFLILAMMLFVFRKQNFKKYLFAGFFIFAVMFSLGAHTPVHAIFYHLLPGMKAFRAPSFMYVWFFLMGITLAGFALDELLAFKWKENPAVTKRLLIFACIVTGLAFLYMIACEAFGNYWYNSFFPAELHNENRYNALTYNFKSAKTGAVLIFLFVASFFIIAYLKAKGIIKTNFFLFLLLVISLIDVIRISRPFLTKSIKPKNYFVRQEKIEQSVERYLKQRDKSIFRVHSMLGDQKMYIPGLEMTYIFDDFINKRYYDIIEILRSASYGLMQSQYAGNNQLQNRYLNSLSLLNTKYVLVLSKLNVLGMREIINSGGLRIYENLYCFPRFYLANGVVAETDAKAAVRKMIDTPLFKKNTVIVNKKIWGNKSLNPSVDSAITGKIDIIIYDTRKGRTVVEVTSNREQFLVVSENNNAGWKATINDKPVDIIPVNYIAKGVVIPKGKSKVEFIYNSPTAATWRKVTAISAILFLIFVLYAGFMQFKSFRK